MKGLFRPSHPQQQHTGTIFLPALAGERGRGHVPGQGRGGATNERSTGLWPLRRKCRAIARGVGMPRLFTLPDGSENNQSERAKEEVTSYTSLWMTDY